MTCEEAARVLDAFSVPNDKLLALQSLKRALKDAESPEGQAAILASIPYEPDRMVALQILSTVCIFQYINQTLRLVMRTRTRTVHSTERHSDH